VVPQGEFAAVPIKGVEGSRSALPNSGISRCVGVGLGWLRILSVIISVFSEIIPHRANFCLAVTPASALSLATLDSNLS